MAHVEPYVDQLYSYARYLTKNEADAEDLMQEAFVRAFKGFGNFVAGTNFRAWMYRIIQTTFLNLHRKNKNAPKAMDEDISDLVFYSRGVSENGGGQAQDGGAVSSGVANSAEMDFLDKLGESEVSMAVKSLPEQFRIPVILADMEGFSYKEIAEIMEVPDGTVMSRLHRGRKMLREVLYEVGLEAGYIQEDPASKKLASEKPASEKPVLQAPVQI